MDAFLARKMTEDLLTKEVGGWKIESYIKHGKSAVVFRASKDGTSAALKAFDPEIVDRFGRDTQRERIRREKQLVGRSHPNLISIYDGGEQDNILYTVMEYFSGPNLADDLQNIPSDNIRSLISQLAKAAKFLEEASFAHRDIKPENIGISTDRRTIKLLDFGVLRPLDMSTITDEGQQRQFIGTLQYSPPELLFREEEDSIDAWRAITYYQIGAVLHDLLTKKQLFSDFTDPYARLVRAVEREIPKIETTKIEPDLRLLAQNCLAKSPKQRLDIVKWEDFDQPQIIDPLDRARKNIALHKGRTLEGESPSGNISDRKRSQLFSLKTIVFGSIVSIINTEKLPRYNHREKTKPEIYTIEINFEPSSSFSLIHNLGYSFQASIIDSMDSFFELKAWCFICDQTKFSPKDFANVLPSRILHGALIEQDIRSFIQECLLTGFAEALEIEIPANDKLMWLKIGGGQ